MKAFFTLFFVFSSLPGFSQIIAGKPLMQTSAEAEATQTIDLIAGGYSEKRKQGYAVSTLEAKDINTAIYSDATLAMIGKVPGVYVASRSGLSGSSTVFRIRGIKTYNGRNYPLYIVDGAPYNTNLSLPGRIYEGNFGSNRSFDLDPNNIASVKVLKGFAATNIYGSAGRNGVVLITTKTSYLANR